jgi:hypothetical protein
MTFMFYTHKYKPIVRADAILRKDDEYLVIWSRKNPMWFIMDAALVGIAIRHVPSARAYRRPIFNIFDWLA